MTFATPDNYTTDAKLAGLKIARNMYTRIDGLHIVSAAGSYIVRVGDRFVSMSPDGLLALVSPAAEMDPERPGVIREGCRWNTFDRERAERLAHHVNTHLCSGAVVEECLDACDGALAALRGAFGDAYGVTSLQAAARRATEVRNAELSKAHRWERAGRFDVADEHSARAERMGAALADIRRQLGDALEMEAAVGYMPAS